MSIFYPGLMFEGLEFIRMLPEAGAQAEIWEAKEIELPGRILAVKLFYWRRGTESHRETQSEWDKAANLWKDLSRHPNVVPLLRYVSGSTFKAQDGQEYGVKMFEMEIANQSLASRIGTDWPPAHPIMLKWMKEIAFAVQTAHRLSPPIVHRDIKPGNVLLYGATDEDMVARVSDFGIARHEGEGTSRRWIGQKYYAAPEQFSGHYTTRSDIYGLGMTYLNMLLGHKFKNVLRGERKLFSRCSVAQVSPEHEKNPLSAALLDLVERMTSENPNSRPDIPDVIEHLKQVEGKLKSGLGVFPVQSTLEAESATEKLSQLCNRFVWHPSLHMAYGETLFLAAIRGFLSVRNMRSSISTLLDPLLGAMYCIYEVFGSTDLVVRVWANEALLPRLKDFLQGITEAIQGDMRLFTVSQLKYFWSGQTLELTPEEAKRQFEDVIKTDVERIADRLVASPLVVGGVNPIDKGTVKAFSLISPYGADDMGLFYRRTNELVHGFLEQGDGEEIDRVSSYYVESDSGTIRTGVILKFHCRYYDSVHKLPIFIHDNARTYLSCRALRTDTYLVASQPSRESDDGPFLRRKGTGEG